MNLQQVIDKLKSRAVEFQAKADDLREDEKGRYAMKWVADELLEIAEYFRQQLAAEDKGHQQQIEEQHIAQHRAHQEYSND